MNNFNSTLRYIDALPRKQRRRNNMQLANTSFSGGGSLPLSSLVTIADNQIITGIKDYINGLKVGGLPIYKSQDDALYLDCNLVVRGGITARGTNETITPSIFEALPIDGDTIKRTADGRLYVDADALNISGGGGVADSVSWENVMGKPTWIGSTKPTYTPQEIGALPITGGTVNGLVQATSFSASEWMSARFFTSDSFPVSANTIGVCRWGTFDEVGGLRIQFGADADTKIEVVNRQWSKSLFSIDTSGNVIAAGGITCRDNFRTHDNYFGFSVKSQGSANSWYGVKAYMPFDEGYTMGVCRIGTSFLHRGLSIGFSTGNPYNYNIPSDYNYTDVVVIRRDGNVSASEITLTKNYQSDNRSITINGEGILFNPPSGYWAFGNTVNINSTSLSAASIFGAGKAVNYYFYGGTYDSPSAIILPNGNMALGGITASEKLHVHGNLLATGGITARYTSDMRLKQNRRSFKASEVLMSLGAVQQFEYIPSEVEKNKIYEGTHIGLIYQNVVGTALNRMCHEREDGYGSLNYLEPSFISLLAGVGQEHEVRIQQLERENRVLKEEVKQLKQRVA